MSHEYGERRWIRVAGMAIRSRNTARVQLGVGVVGLVVASLTAVVLTSAPGERTDPLAAFLFIAAMSMWMLRRGVRGLRPHSAQ
jgi:hypothetical protein